MTTYSVKLKTTFHDSSLPVVSVQHPAAALGKSGKVRTVQINDVPEDISPAAVARMYSLTCDVSWLHGGLPRQEFAYSELGEGKIIGGTAAS